MFPRFHARLPFRFRLPPRWMVMTAAAYLALALLLGPRVGLMLASHAHPPTAPPATATIAVTTTTPASAPNGYIPVPAGAPRTDASSSTGADRSAGQP